MSDARTAVSVVWMDGWMDESMSGDAGEEAAWYLHDFRASERTNA